MSALLWGIELARRFDALVVASSSSPIAYSSTEGDEYGRLVSANKLFTADRTIVRGLVSVELY